MRSYGKGNKRILLFILFLKLLRHGGFIGTAYAGGACIGLPVMVEPVGNELQNSVHDVTSPLCFGYMITWSIDGIRSCW